MLLNEPISPHYLQRSNCNIRFLILETAHSKYFDIPVGPGTAAASPAEIERAVFALFESYQLAIDGFDVLEKGRVRICIL